MLKKLQDGLLLTEDLKLYKREINKENRLALHLFAEAGLFISIANAIAQAVVRGTLTPPLNSYIMPFFLAAVILMDRYLIPSDFKYSTLVLYIVQGVLMLNAILLGTVFDPNHQASSILLFLLFMPAFILDYPIRSILIHAFWSALFIFLCYKIKNPYLFQTDAIHVVEFFFASVTETIIVTRIHLNNMRRLSETRYVIDHDPQTGCYSRQALLSRISRYVKQPTAVITTILNDLTTYSDFYGHDSANTMMVSFASILSNIFGEENTYRYRGNEFFCVIEHGTEDECRQRIEAVRQKLERYRINDIPTPLYADFGYVTGNASDETEFRQMAQLADIYLHKAGKKGHSQTHGGPFDQKHLREGIIESNLGINAPSYEINQLTGLPGMSYFTVHSTDLLNTVVDLSRRPVVGYLKLLRLRQFNNEFGYESGDLLIADTAKLLQHAFENRSVGYITAGKFCMMCYLDEVEPGLKSVNEVLESYKPGFHAQIIGGFAEYTGEQSVISLLDQAKIAEHSIRKKKASYCLFDHAMEEENRFRQYILNHVDEALENEYLKVYYQPIARALTGHICNEEALCRWDDPVHGFLMPYKFIPFLEESAMMYKVNLFVVSKVLEDLKTRQKLGVPVVPVSVNLSRSDFEQCDMVSSITAMVDEAGFSHDILKIEITESAFIEDQELLKRELSRFRDAGFEVWLDDFGSEYSTLNLLQEIDFDLLKIDMQFMKNFSTTGKNFIIISDIIDMAKRMGITTLIEGIETNEHYEILQQLGCEKIQGYLFNKPNNHSYIIERALSGNGLTFEDPKAAPYYSAIGRIDLKNPSRADALGEVSREYETASSVLEWKDHSFTCLEATDTFRSLMKSLHLMSDDSSNQQIVNPPADMISAAEQSIDCSKRFSFSIKQDEGHRYTFYVRRISDDSYNGAIALLVTILQNRSA